MKIHELLKELNACDEAQDWASARTWEQIYNECHRGDWLCWLFARTNPKDIQLLTLVKGHQANTVRHLMNDERSLSAVDAAIAFGEGKITLDELNLAATKAFDAKSSFHTSKNKAATYVAYYAAKVHANASAVAYYAATYAAADAADAADAAYAAEAKKQNQKETADIFRKFIKITEFTI